MSITILKREKSGHPGPRILFTAVILVSVILVSTVWAKKDAGQTAVVTVDYLPVRSTPTLVTATVAQLSEGQIVSLTGHRTQDSQWVQVRLPGLDGGWVPADAIRTRSNTANFAVPASVDGRSIGGVAVVAGEHVFVRKTWDSTRPVVTRLGQGEQMELTGFRSADGQWVEVSLPGNQVGWVEAGSIASAYPLSALVPMDVAQ